IAVTPCAVLTRGGHSNCGNRWSVALATGRPDRLGRPDLLGEHPHVERTRGRVRIDVLALRLVALDEVSGRARQVLRARQPDHHGLGHDGTPELTRTGRAHGAASVSTIDARGGNAAPADGITMRPRPGPTCHRVDWGPTHRRDLRSNSLGSTAPRLSLRHDQ